MAKSKLTPEFKEKFFYYIKLGLPYISCCNLCRIDESQFYRWLKKAREDKTHKTKYYTFHKELKEAESVGEAKLVKDIQQDPSWQSKAWILERRHRDRWAREKTEEVKKENVSGFKIEIIRKKEK